MGFLTAVEKHGTQRGETPPAQRPPIKAQDGRKPETPPSTPTPSPPLSPERVAFVESLTLEELGKVDFTVTVWSEVMGGPVLLVPNHYKAAEGDPPTFTARELAVLLLVKPETIPAVLAVKKVLEGELLWTGKDEEMGEKT